MRTDSNPPEGSPEHRPPTPGARIMTYPLNLLAGDLARAGTGFAASMLLIFSLPLASVVWWFALILGAIALVIAWRAARLAMTRIIMGDQDVGLELSLNPKDPGARSVLLRLFAWEEMTGLRVRNYAERGHYAPQVVQIEIIGPGGPVRADHRLDGFPQLVTRAWTAAQTRRLPLDRRTIANLRALAMDGRINRALLQDEDHADTSSPTNP